MQRLELLHWRATGLIRDEVPKLTQDVTANLERIFVTGWKAYRAENLPGRVPLKSFFVVGNYLDNTKPHLSHAFTKVLTSGTYHIVDVISGNGNQLKDDIDVPRKVRCEFLRKNGNLQNHFLTNGKV